MSADNFFFIRKDGVVEDRILSNEKLPGLVIHRATDQDTALNWALAVHDDDPLATEYGITLEGERPSEISDRRHDG